MDDVGAWLRDRPYYDGQLTDTRTLPGHEAETASLSMPPRLERALSEQGITDLYRHQVAAIEAVRDETSVVLATPTASGKSLAYTVPAFERALDHGGRTLYIGPQNALIADQLTALSELADALGFGSNVRVAEYTGRLDDDERRAVRDQRPTVLLTNPDMLHYGILPHGHRLWEWFLEGLETIVVDEIHAYRGIFGAHVGLVLRRLQRLADRYDAAPEIVCCSATIGNPVAHASRMTGRDRAAFRLVDTDCSAQGPRHWFTWNPPLHEGPAGQGRRRSSHVAAKRLFCDLVTAGQQTLVFTRARQTAERYAEDAAQDLRARGEDTLASQVTAYEAALTDSRRREIEAGLNAGELRGVWSTNALEMGVDVGGLDAVILDGYPGTRTETFQEAGRAGRGDDPAVVVLIPGEDQLDQFVATHPSTVHDGDPEDAVVDPENPEVLPDHVRCAARENWLSEADETHFGPTFPDLVQDLTATGALARRATEAGPRWTFAGSGSPHHEVSVRGDGGGEVQLRRQRTDEVIASLSVEDAMRDAHPGAIYTHQGRTYEVVQLDLDQHVAQLSPTWADYHTRVLTDKSVTVDRDITEKRPLGRDDVPVRLARVTVREEITGFQRRDNASGTVLGTEHVDLPARELSTEGFYWTLPAEIEQAHVRAGDLPGSIHAAEHAAISMLPTRLLCDRGDVGGLSTPSHSDTGRPTVFVYDGYEGGVGIARVAFDRLAALLEDTHTMLADCSCADGCPACVQSPQCGNANEPLTRQGAIELLGRLLDTA
ncbi:MAG: DEAD/DEAH box helicase [Halobacteriaceae archaeon]